MRRKLSETAGSATASAGASLRETLSGRFVLDEHVVAESVARDADNLGLAMSRAYAARPDVKISARDLE